jgi:hypothetical protein
LNPEIGTQHQQRHQDVRHQVQFLDVGVPQLQLVVLHPQSYELVHTRLHHDLQV